MAWDDLDHGRPARFGGRHRTARGVSSEAPGRRGGRAGAYLVETSPQEAIALLYSALGRRSTPSAPPGRLEWTYVSTPSTFTGWRERSGREQGPQRRPSGAGFARTGGSFRRSDRSSPDTGQPMTTSEWLDRLTPKATAVLAVGTCAEARGDPITRRRSTGGRLPEGTGTAMRLASYGRPTRVSAGKPGRQSARSTAGHGQALVRATRARICLPPRPRCAHATWPRSYLKGRPWPPETAGCPGGR